MPALGACIWLSAGKETIFFLYCFQENSCFFLGLRLLIRFAALFFVFFLHLSLCQTACLSLGHLACPACLSCTASLC